MRVSQIKTQKVLGAQLWRTPTNNSAKSNIGSLKAILNQGRVPLSQYINEKPNRIDKNKIAHLSYFDKLKVMFNRHSDKDTTERNVHQKIIDENQQIQSNTIDLLQLNNYAQKFEHSPFNKIHQNPFTAQNQRSRSVLCKSHDKKSSEKKQQRHFYDVAKFEEKIKQKISQLRPSIEKQVNYTQNDSLQECGVIKEKKILISKNKDIKRELVNYKKFNILFQTSQSSNFHWIELSDILGSGANAIVRLGTDKKKEIKYAIKIYEKYKLIDANKKRRVLKEIEILSKVDHPNIIRLFCCFEDKRQIHMIFQYIENAVTLQQFIRMHNYHIDQPLKKSIVIKIANAVDELHQSGVSHRDIKTDNIIVNSGGIVKLIDFGFATKTTKAQTHCGTPNYMAPELFDKKIVYSPYKVDIWALGILIYYVYEGSYPFRGYNEKDLIRNIYACNYSFKKAKDSIQKIVNSTLQVNAQSRIGINRIIQLLSQ